MIKQHSVTMNGATNSVSNFRVKIEFYYPTTLILVCEYRCITLIFVICKQATHLSYEILKINTVIIL